MDDDTLREIELSENDRGHERLVAAAEASDSKAGRCAVATGYAPSLHTPGPWIVSEEKIPHYLGGSHVSRTIHTGYDHGQLKCPYPVVTMSYGIGATREGRGAQFVHINEENARLIAAAPELLSALEKLLFAAENADETGYVTDAGFIDLSAVYAQARAAITKAVSHNKTAQPRRDSTTQNHE